MASKLVSQLDEIMDRLMSNADDLITQSHQDLAVLKDGLEKTDVSMLRYGKHRKLASGSLNQ